MASATSGVPWLGDGEMAVGEASGQGAAADVGTPAQSSSESVGGRRSRVAPGETKLCQILVQVAGPVPSSGARRDAESASPGEIRFDPVHPQDQLGFYGAGDLVGKRARRRKRRCFWSGDGSGKLSVWTA